MPLSDHLHIRPCALLLVVAAFVLAVTPSARAGLDSPTKPADSSKPADDAQPIDDSKMIDKSVAVLQGLDKITARVSTFEVVVGETARFGTLLITPRACREAPPIEPPEATAFLEISEVKPDEKPMIRFSGWMFASSPSLSALEHPIYDVWVTGCGDKKE